MKALPFLVMLLPFLIHCGDTEEDPTPKAIKMVLELENISAEGAFKGSNDMNIPLPLAPGFYAVTSDADALFAVNTSASDAMETLAEVGNPNILIDLAKGQSTTAEAGILGDIDNPNYKESPIQSGGKATLIITIKPSHKLVVASMLGVSNDIFLGTKPGGFDLSTIDPNTTIDITKQFTWWDAGTEVNEPIGEGPHQVSNAPGTDTGTEEMGLMRPADLKDNNGKTLLPNVNQVVRVTLKPY